ncbi:MAG: hypothetical protein ACI92B_000777 [Marinobacter maritimus]|jgi:hypothetical protein
MALNPKMGRWIFFPKIIFAIAISFRGAIDSSLFNWRMSIIGHDEIRTPEIIPISAVFAESE